MGCRSDYLAATSHDGYAWLRALELYIRKCEDRLRLRPTKATRMQE